ncbi:MAG TPA: ribose-phosphate pyrophosphokinase [Patescibacteria group bacterium]|nr:ribose-phosphate pyrophosphokinase [Patescibacteria group bacterium]
MKIFSGSANKPLAEKVAESLNISLSPVEIFVFPDGERRVRLEEDVVNEDVVIIQSTTPPVDQNYMELFFLIDGAKRSGAKNITVVMPYLGYQRQDHVFRSGEAVSFQVIVKILESIGVSRVIACDLHTIKIPEFFTIPFTHLSALQLFAEKIQEVFRDSLSRDPVNRSFPTSARSSEASFNELRAVGSPPAIATPDSDTILVTPDMGGIRRIKILSEMLDEMPYVMIEKNRDLATGKVEVTAVHGPSTGSGFKGKKAIIVDDMISSGRTIVNAANILKEKGVEETLVFATHPIFSDEAPELLQNAPVEKVYVTDTVLIPEKKQFAKLTVLTISSMVADHVTS